MAIKVRQSTSEGTGSGSFKLYTGVAPMKVIAINPTQDQLKQMGFKAEKAPAYKTDKGTRINLHVEFKNPAGKTVKTQFSFFIGNKKSDKIFINKKGKFAGDRTKLTGDLRNPYNGEIELLDFIGKWCDIRRDEDLYLDTIDRIAATGDITEIRQIFQQAKDNVFKGLLGIREGKYQTVYTGMFERGYSKTSEYLFKNLVRNEERLDAYYGPIDFKLFSENAFALREHDKADGSDDSNEEDAVDSALAGTTADAAVATGESDDTPF